MHKLKQLLYRERASVTILIKHQDDFDHGMVGSRLTGFSSSEVAGLLGFAQTSVCTILHRMVQTHTKKAQNE